MAGNSFGEIFKITTFGESHGPAIGVVIDGVPPNLPLNESDIQFELNRRRPGQSVITTQRQEADTAHILSGVLAGRTTGTPLAILINNTDQQTRDYEALKNIFRPGHADFGYQTKFGIRDYRGGGRSSGRETACRVAAGAIAKKILRNHNINIIAYTLAIGDITAKKIDLATIEKNPVRCPDPEAALLMAQKIEIARNQQNSLGGIIQAVAHGCPAGLGDPVFDKLNACLAHAVMSIGGVSGVEFGDGFAAAARHGLEQNDKFYMDGDKVRTMTNHAGGILGGISTGADIILRVAFKPTASISQPQQSVTVDGKDTSVEIHGRHDPCICPRAVVVVEAMIAVTILDRLLIQKIIRESPASV
ncbi:MAG: chorismate synthase [Candidatus Omnitrophica bacterium]|nr:chorismate synthase [Candidatus Omnitrophota bacterium]